MIAITEITRPTSLGRASSVSAWSLRSWSLRPLTFPARPVDARAAFTLVELLVTIAIISILATALLGAASLAGGTAREARTKARILRIHPLLMEHYDTYKNRRVELHSNMEGLVTAAAPKDQGKVRALYRLRAARELMKMEIPDRWSDIWLGQIPSSVSAINAALTADTEPDPQYMAERSGLNSVYVRRLRQIALGIQSRSIPDSEKRKLLLENQGAECLYLVVMLATADGEARSLFSEHTIGDTDGDGAQEFIDGWGNPIEFLRWAPNLHSDLQLSFDRILQVSQGTDGLTKSKELLASDPDPFDIYRVGQTNFEVPPITLRGFRLVPLVYSAGSDEEYGLTGGPDDTSLSPGFTNALSNPYYYDNGQTSLIGKAINESSHIDNITNHLIVGN